MSQISPIETRFALKSFSDKQQQQIPVFQQIRIHIMEDGHFIINNLKFYTPQIAIILITKNLKVTNMDKGEDTTLDGMQYFETYETAYQKGVQMFVDDFGVLPNTLYGVNAEKYVSDIHFNYFHKEIEGIHEGWGFVKKAYPTIITHKVILKFGFYSGLISKVDEMVNKYPKLFSEFEQCEHSTIPHQEPPRPMKINTEHSNSKILPLKLDDIENPCPSIFKNAAAFSIWSKMFDDFNIISSSRTDLRFMFDTMQDKRNGLIYATVKQKDILDWINVHYELAVDKLPYKNFKTDSKRMAIYFNASRGLLG